MGDENETFTHFVKNLTNNGNRESSHFFSVFALDSPSHLTRLECASGIFAKSFLADDRSG